MSKKLLEIIAKIDPSATLYLSNFTPHHIFTLLRDKGFLIKLLPSTLLGTIDTKAMKAFDPSEKAVILLYPFYQERSSQEELQKMQKSYNFTLYELHEETEYALQNIQQIYAEGLQSSKDVTCSEITSAQAYIIHLAPYMFCPKDEIISYLKQAGVALDTKLTGLYQDPYFESIKTQHMTAHECRLGFIALSCEISAEQAQNNVAAILEALQQQSMRRCSF